MRRLYTYFRSSAAYRVRIALNLKGLAYDACPVHLLRNGGEQHAPAYAERNPAELVPLLEEDGFALPQSLAIIEYLEQCYPDPPLLPQDPQARAQVRAFALAIAADIHPLCNLRVLQLLERLGLGAEQLREWSCQWMINGLRVLERILEDAGGAGPCCFGSQPTMADCCLIPLLFNAQRLQCPLSDYPRLERIYRHCLSLPAFQLAAPDAQPDAQ